MPKYNYVALDSHGKETKGTIEVASQNEAIGRVKEMGLYPDQDRRVRPGQGKAGKKAKAKPAAKAGGKKKGGALTSKSRSPASAAGSSRRC